MINEVDGTFNDAINKMINFMVLECHSRQHCKSLVVAPGEAKRPALSEPDRASLQAAAEQAVEIPERLAVAEGDTPKTMKLSLFRSCCDRR